MKRLAGIVAALMLALLIPAAPAFAQTPAPAPSAGPIVHMDRISIQSIGAGEPLILIPGLASPREVWMPFVTRLAETRQVLPVQVNGFGGDEPGANAGEGIIPGIVADLSAYIARERLGRVSVVGHSMGGLVGMILARDHPEQVRRLMVVDALPFFGALMSPDATVDSMRQMATMMRGAVQSGAATPPSADDRNVAIMSNTPAGRLQVSRWAHAANRQIVGQAMYEDLLTDLRPDVGRIGAVPVTVLHASPAAMAERAAALYRDAYAAAPSIRVIAVPDSYHFVMLDQPDRFRAELDAFLAR